MKRFLFFCLILFPVSGFAERGLPEKPYIYVEGKSEVQKQPDIVTLRFELITRAPEQLKANQDVQGKANKILALLKDKKIANNDIIAGNLRSEPQFEQEENYPNKRGKLIGYQVTRPFQVKVRDVTIFPKLADDLMAIGGVEFSGVDGGLAREKEMEGELWDKALANAHERARENAQTNEHEDRFSVCYFTSAHPRNLVDDLS